MRKLLLVILTILYLLPVKGQNIVPYQNGIIGKVYTHIYDIDKLKNYKTAEGIVIESSQNIYGFSKISDGKTTLILFDSFIAPASYKILAVLDISNLEKGNRTIMSRCRMNKINDDYIVAIVKPAKGDFFKNVLKAWRVNAKTNQFISIPVAGIDCINDEDESD